MTKPSRRIYYIILLICFCGSSVPNPALQEKLVLNSREYSVLWYPQLTILVPGSRGCRTLRMGSLLLHFLRANLADSRSINLTLA